MSAALRPLTLGDILDRTFSIYRSRFRLCLGISALAALGIPAIFVVVRVFDELISETTLSTAMKANLASPGAIGLDTWHSLCRFLAWPVFVFVAAEEFFGKRAAFRPAIAQCARRWRSWLAICALLWAIWNGLPALVQSVPILERARTNAMQSFMEGSLFEWPRSPFFYWLGWIVSLAVSAAVWMSVPVRTLENASLRQVPGRAMKLIKRAYLRIAATWFMTALVGLVLAAAVTFVMAMAMRIVFAVTGNPSSFLAMRLALFYLPGITSTVFVGPLFPIALTLIYYDQRIRQEGLDIEMMMDAAGMNASSESVPAEMPVPAVEGGEQPE